MFFSFIHIFVMFYLFESKNYIIASHTSHAKKQIITKENILHNKSLIKNGGLDERNKKILEENNLNNKNDLLKIAKNFDKKKLLDYLQNKDISIISKLDRIEKYSYFFDENDSNTKYTGLKKEMDDFLSL